LFFIPISSSALATHEFAKHQTRKVDGFIQNSANDEDLVWGLAATRGSLSMPHIDDDGLAAVVTIMSGSKWWVLLRSRRDADVDDHRGDLFSIQLFPLNWEHCSSGRAFLEAEAIHLKAGDTL
jgi:hypothetical protein